MKWAKRCCWQWWWRGALTAEWHSCSQRHQEVPLWKIVGITSLPGQPVWCGGCKGLQLRLTSAAQCLGDGQGLEVSSAFLGGGRDGLCGPSASFWIRDLVGSAPALSTEPEKAPKPDVVTSPNQWEASPANGTYVAGRLCSLLPMLQRVLFPCPEEAPAVLTNTLPSQVLCRPAVPTPIFLCRHLPSKEQSSSLVWLKVLTKIPSSCWQSPRDAVYQQGSSLSFASSFSFLLQALRNWDWEKRNRNEETKYLLPDWRWFFCWMISGFPPIKPLLRQWPDITTQGEVNKDVFNG